MSCAGACAVSVLEAQTAEVVRICLATQNAGKLSEFRRLWDEVNWVSLADLGVTVQVDETGDTFAENALIKARAAARLAGLPALADDSGLEVDALDGRPGVHSARYAGPNASDAENNAKLLEALRGVPMEARTARFRCAVALVREDGQIWSLADGVCEGHIGTEMRGDGGFGYDPLFVPEGEPRTMAQLSAAEKNAISHRAAAVRALRDQLERAT